MKKYFCMRLLLGIFFAFWFNPSSVMAQECNKACVSGGWLGELIGYGIEAKFEEACERFDNCYCHGAATYCKTKDDCDDDFIDDTLEQCVFEMGECKRGCTLSCSLECLNSQNPDCYGNCLNGCNFDCDSELLLCTTIIGVGLLKNEIADVNWTPEELQTCNDYDHRGGEWACTGQLETVYVNANAQSCPVRGTEENPVASVTSGVSKVQDGGCLVIESGEYNENLTITGKKMQLKKRNGAVYIKKR